MDNEVTLYLKNYDKLKGDRSVFESHWQDVSKYVLPNRDFYQTYTPGQKRNARIFDTTGVWANEQLAGGLHGMLTSPSLKWFAIKVDDPTFQPSDASRLWLDQVTNILYNIFSSPSNNFNSQCHEMYLELCAFGTGIFFSEYRNNKVVFRAFPLSECFLKESEDGVVDTVYRCSKMTPHAAVQFFKGDTPEEIIKLYEKDPFGEPIEIIHIVEPRKDKEIGKAGYNKPFKSCYIYKDKKKKIGKEGGYDTFPYQTPRFQKRSGETYGFGPGMAAFPDIKMLNRMGEATIRGMEKMVDPPLLVPNDSVFGPLVINPGGVINYSPLSSGEKIEALNTNARPEIANDAIARYQSRVIQHFYVDWMNLPQGAQMTATEVLQRRDERLRLLGPMLSRMQSEFTGKLIDRVFSILNTNGIIPVAPEEIRGANLKIEYLSPIAQAQRFSELESIIRSLQLGMQFAQFDPMAMSNFRTDDIIRYAAAEVNNVPQRLLATQEEMVNIRQSQAQAADAQSQAQLNELDAKSIKNTANAMKFMAQTGTEAKRKNA